MKTIETQARIPMPPAIVWATLIDFDRYSEWNPFMIRVVGKAVPGSRLQVTIRPRGKKSVIFRPKVLRVEPNRHLQWLGRLGLPKVFDGLHEFILVEEADGGTLLYHRETFSGLLPALMGKSLDSTRDGFEAFNQALTARACSVQ